MEPVTGYVGESPEGLVRIYRLDDPHRFIDVPYEGLESAGSEDQELVATVTFKEGVDVTEGALDDASYQAMFADSLRTPPYDTFYCDSGFWHCKHTIEIC